MVVACMASASRPSTSASESATPVRVAVCVAMRVAVAARGVAAVARGVAVVAGAGAVATTVSRYFQSTVLPRDSSNPRRAKMPPSPAFVLYQCSLDGWLSRPGPRPPPDPGAHYDQALYHSAPRWCIIQTFHGAWEKAIINGMRV